MNAMISRHEQAIVAFKQESNDMGRNLVKMWAANAALPTLKHHLAVARNTAKQVGATDEQTPGAVPASNVEHAPSK